MDSLVIGYITGVSSEGRPLVDWEGNTAGPIPAREGLGAPLGSGDVLLVFEKGDPFKPIILSGLKATAPLQQPEIVEVDGKRICIEGKDEVMLRCGKASITLRRNGKVIIRGAYLDTESSGIHRIKGAALKLN